MPRYICIHGHFYQPPRANPWTRQIDRQPSAAPFRDWNERIAAECYRPNTAARVLDKHGLIKTLRNNYSGISFNFGPTLLSWLIEHDPDTHARLVRADRDSRKRMDGHGSAWAQPYNHLILPLANARDRKTQIRWGIADFQRHFGRPPEGMWLPETGVDAHTLEDLAEAGIRFTLLAPHQAVAVRPPGHRDDMAIDEHRLDTTRGYRCPLPSGRSIDLYFYDGPISRDVAFAGLLEDGHSLARRLVRSARSRRPDGLTHIACDGETYGHHHRHGEMALAVALEQIEGCPDIRLCNYGLYNARHPPTWEVKIRDPSAWSCAHGVERWRSDCGCCISSRAGWTQAWRTPLRDALDGLRDDLATRYEADAARLVHDPWLARDDYIQIILDPSTTDDFLARHIRQPLTPEAEQRLLDLLELQHQTLLMFTSCGWFFDDISGIEAAQNLLSAARAVDLARALWNDPEPGDRLLATLAQATSNEASQADGRQIYLRALRRAHGEDDTPLQQRLDQAARSLAAQPPSLSTIDALIELLEDAKRQGTPTDPWLCQTLVWEHSQAYAPEHGRRTAAGDPAAQRWCARLQHLQDLLGIACTSHGANASI